MKLILTMWKPTGCFFLATDYSTFLWLENSSSNAPGQIICIVAPVLYPNCVTSDNSE